jgi:hypothetical protein
MGKCCETAGFALDSWEDGSSYSLTNSLAVGSTADTLVTPHPLKSIGLAQILTRARLSTLNTLTRIAIIHYWVCASVHTAVNGIAFCSRCIGSLQNSVQRNR